MLHYFALDPAICRNLQDFRYCTEHCHPCQGRVIADLPPGEWIRACVDEIEAALSANELQPVKAKSLKERLRKLRGRTINRPGDGWSYSGNWLQDAFEEHARDPYTALVSPSVSHGEKEACFLPDELDEETSGWYSPTGVEINRSPGEFTKTVAGLVAVSREVHLVDRGFSVDPDRTYLRAFQDLIRRVAANTDSFPKITLHFCPKEGLNSTYAQGELDSLLSSVLPVGSELTVLQWVVDSGVKLKAAHPFHNRFLLTNLCGVQVGYGMDFASSKTDSKDHLQLLDQRVWKGLYANAQDRQFPLVNLHHEFKVLSGRKK